MGKISVTNCVFLCLTILCVRCQFLIEGDSQNRIPGESLPLILKFLNDDSETVISYNSGEIRRTQLKGDILEVDITASVICKSPSNQCNYVSADCRGLLFVRPNSELQVISVDCNPILPIEEPIALPIQEVHCEGCLIDINPDAEGVEQLAKNVIQHIESDKGKKYDLIKITRVQQEVTNGVNFVLTALIGRLPYACTLPAQECNRDTKEDMYCSVKFFQEPGYQSPKNIISNNCTNSQTFIPIIPDYQTNNINDAIEKKNKYEEKSELSENDILKDLDSQIIPTDEFESTKNEEKLQPGVVINIETSSVNNLPEESSPSVVSSSTLQEVVATEDEPISVGTDAGVNRYDIEGKASQSTQEITKGSTADHSEQQVLDGNTDVSSASSDLEGKVKQADNPETIKRDKRSLVGGKKEMDVDNPTVKEYAGKGIDFLNTKLSTGNSIIKIDRIISATSQVVAGASYDIKAQIVECTNEENSTESCKTIPRLCDINVWYRPWLESRIITVKLDGETYSFDELQSKGRSKRETLVGGWYKKESEDPKAMQHLGNLLSNLDAQSGMDNKLRIKKILSVSTQVVAGTNWLVKALVSRSDCKKSDEKPAVDCGEDKNAFETECSFKFWEKLPDANGLRQLENVEIECDSPKLNYRTKRDVLVGGHNPLSNEDPRIAKHLNSLITKLDALSKEEHKLKIKNIISATSQVVAGTNWRIKASVSLSDCKKTDKKSSIDCGDNEKPYETICEFKFWEKLPDKNGLRTLENVKIDCEDNKLTYRSKREANQDNTNINLNSRKGGQGMVDINEPEILEFVTESLQHMEKQSENKLKIKDILSATKQVVSGILWRIKAVVVVSDCKKSDLTNRGQCDELQGADPKYCLIKVWNRPWIPQGRETNITCDKEDAYTFKSGTGSSNMESEVYAAFEEFVKTHNKQYLSPAERVRRFSIFRENMRYVKLLNEHEQGTAKYGATKFADLTRKEFSESLGYRSDLKNENEVSFMKAAVPNVNLPDSFDWREKNAVTEVKNQGSCGSCWAFSVTGNVEGQYAIKNGKLLEFSEQELVDCDKEDQGCNGGLMDNAYRQIEKLGGLEEEQDYPYDARDEKCHLNKALVRVELSGAVNISQDETEMAKWLVKNGPISIAINANAMQFYMGGVSHPWKVLCNPKSLDHGVLIVGYGVHTYPKFKKSLPYWIVKNSWGTSWGEQGYYRVYRGDGTCGVNQTPSSAILK